MSSNARLDPDTAELVSAAFEKSWQFVKTDPELAHPDPQHMRVRLAESLARLAQDGERDMWRLANAAIGQLRRNRHAGFNSRSARSSDRGRQPDHATKPTRAGMGGLCGRPLDESRRCV